MKDTLEKFAVAFTATLLLDLVDPPRSPGVDRRVHIAKGPLIRRKLAVGVHVPFAEHQESVAPWRNPDPPMRVECSGTPGPTPHTTGYSHLSGMEMTSPLMMCVHS